MLLTMALTVAIATTQIDPTETVYKLKLEPAAAPRPALRYLLLPELKEMTPGNPIAGYMQCFLDQDFVDKKEIMTKSGLRQADRAARMDRPDWQMLVPARKEGFAVNILQDLQRFRALAAALDERLKTEIAQGRFDEAIATVKTILAMSRHLSEQSSLLADLVGIAMAQIPMMRLQEMAEQPGCPNLYWALTNLPHPLISLDRGMEGERLNFHNDLSDLDDGAPMTADQLKRAIEQIDRLRLEPDETRETTREWLDARIKDLALVSAARARLAESGIPRERLLRFPPEQVLLLDEKRHVEVDRDEFMKFAQLPTWQAMELGDRLVKNEKKEQTLLDFVGKSVHKVRFSNGRLEQRIAILRHIEAIRLYAAENKGRLPAKLGDIGVPLPADPFSGQPFIYKLEGDTAHLRNTPPAGFEKNYAFNFHYELVMRKP